MYASVDVVLKFRSALPNVIALVVGMPSRKSAKSEPVAFPLKVNVPRGLSGDETRLRFQVASPPAMRLWWPRDHASCSPPPAVRSRVCTGSPSLRPAIVENCSDGGPQLEA